MDQIALKLYTFKGDGTELVTEWTVPVLTYRPSRLYARQTGTAGSLRLRRRPLARQFRRTVKLPAGFLLDDDQRKNFGRLLDAHKIELQRTIGKKLVWVEVDLDLEDKVEFEHLNDLDPVWRYEFTLVASDATWYTDFENGEDNFTD